MMREDISSEKLLEAAEFNDNIKVYSKPVNPNSSSYF